jgi:hypothetical protein
MRAASVRAAVPSVSPGGGRKARYLQELDRAQLLSKTCSMLIVALLAAGAYLPLVAGLGGASTFFRHPSPAFEAVRRTLRERREGCFEPLEVAIS